MKKPVLVLLALLALIPFAQAMAQTPPVAAPPANSATTPAPDAATAQFLATLSGGQGQTPKDLAPAPSFMAGCTTSAQCPQGKLCCNVCGNPPDDGGSCRGCLTPIRGRCPLIV
jgi:hypothetical protein